MGQVGNQSIEITYLYLKNFAPIYTGMKKTEIELSFKNKRNLITLIVGLNGTGKTFIESHLQPFADTGNLDIRSSTNTLIEGKNAEKRINITYGENEYRISHFFKNTKNGVIVKSFIAKNDEELNPNGNVTSFKEVVKFELGVDEDYLKISRLGSNTDNLIKMKPTQRKFFLATRLPDIKMCMDKYKKITNDSRMLKGLIKSLTDKIEKLHILDIDLLQNDIDTISSEILSYRDKISVSERELGKLESFVLDVLPNGIDKFNDDNERLHDEYKDIKSELNNLVCTQEGIPLNITTTIEDYRIQNETKFKECNDKIISLNNTIQYDMTSLSKAYNKKDELTTKLNQISSNEKIDDLLSLKSGLSKKIHKSKCVEPPFTQEELNNTIKVITDINNTICEIHKYSLNSINSTIDVLSNGYNFDNYVNSALKEIGDSINLASFRQGMNVKESVLVLYTPTDCEVDKCSYKDIVNSLVSDEYDNMDIDKLESNKELLYEMMYVHPNIQYITKSLSMNKDLFKKCNIEINTDSIHGAIKRRQLIDTSIIQPLLSDIEKYNEYVKLEEKYKEVEHKLSILQSSIDIITMINDEIFRVEKDISELESCIDTNKNLLSDQKKLSEDIEIEYSNIIAHIELNKRISEIKDIKKEIKITINKNNDLLTSLEYIITKISSIKRDINDINTSIIKMEEDVFNKKVSYSSYLEFNREKNILDDKFSDIEITKESLSPAKGIPLLYMQLFTQNTKIIMNEVLEPVYHGDLEVADFEITPTEFNIPYIKDGVQIPDVSYASDGERAFLTLALSFAMLSNYNILLLDELDGPLDGKNRALFLDTLEKGMIKRGISQSVLITHNDMFDAYPVDIIMTSPVDVQDNATVIARLYE